MTELVLAQSRYQGEPVRVSTSRYYLARAVRLGFTEVQVQSPSDPILCRDRNRVFLWQPLSKDSAIEPTDDAIRIESTTSGSAPRPAARTNGERIMSRDEPQAQTPTEHADRREKPSPARRRTPTAAAWRR